jgi:predicted tellurium resistance membrane protein TerC
VPLLSFDVAGMFTTDNLVALLTLTSLEIVLGIDNVVFIAILCGKLPPARRETARRVGLTLAMATRILLLLTIGWLAGLKEPLFTVDVGFLDHAFSGRDLILAIGGLFLVGKATLEIHHKLEGPDLHGGLGPSAVHAAFGGVIVQILALDIVFSLDSVITAVGMAQHLGVMIAAVVISVLVMLMFSGKISAFIEHRPTLKVLALSFLLMIGVTLVVDGCGGHVPKGYVYFAMAFSLGVELVNLKVRAQGAPLQLKDSHLPEKDSP